MNNKKNICGNIFGTAIAKYSDMKNKTNDNILIAGRAIILYSFAFRFRTHFKN